MLSLQLVYLLDGRREKIETAIVGSEDLPRLAIKPERRPRAIFRNVMEKIAECVFMPEHLRR